jgi:hypothetical protein
MIHIMLMKIFNHTADNRVTSSCNKRYSSYGLVADKRNKTVSDTCILYGLQVSVMEQHILEHYFYKCSHCRINETLLQDFSIK